MENQQQQQQQQQKIINLDDFNDDSDDDNDNDNWKLVKLHFDEIDKIEKEGAILLGKIQIQEDYLNFAKQNGKLDKDDLIYMIKLIVEFLNCLSLIDAYSLLNHPLDIDSFMLIANKCYSTRLQQFIYYFCAN